MISTKVLFNELADTLNAQAKNFYCRVSFDKYFEPDKPNLMWTWKAIVGDKTKSFFCTLTSFGVTNASSLLDSDYSEAQKHHAMQLLNSYAEWLSHTYDPKVKEMNGGDRE